MTDWFLQDIYVDYSSLAPSGDIATETVKPQFPSSNLLNLIIDVEQIIASNFQDPIYGKPDYAEMKDRLDNILADVMFQGHRDWYAGNGHEGSIQTTSGSGWDDVDPSQTAVGYYFLERGAGRYRENNKDILLSVSFFKT